MGNSNDMHRGGFVRTDPFAQVPLLPEIEIHGDSTNGNDLVTATAGESAWDVRALAAAVQTAGRPWALKPEALETLAAALRNGVQANAFGPPEAPEEAENLGHVAVIPLKGMITPSGMGGILGMFGMGGGGLEQFRGELGLAMTDETVKSIIIDVDSPGGLVDQVPETAAMVREAREAKPITAVASTQAASAAYWIASQASELVVTPSGEVGSIGVYMMHMDKSRMLDHAGVNVTLTSAGKYKVEGNQFEPLSGDAKQAFQDRVDQYYSMFVDDVALGREVPATVVENGYGEGRTLLAKRAVEAGLADRVATVGEVISDRLSTVTPPKLPATAEATARSRRLEIELL